MRMRMRKSKITKWKCDRCGLVITSNRIIIRPLGMCNIRIKMDNTCFYDFKDKRDLCTKCTKEFEKMYNDWLNGEVIE